MDRRLFLLFFLPSLLALAACGFLTARPTPTVYYAPATPVVYVPPAPTPQMPSGPVTVLLLGIDRRGANSVVNNTDTLMLLRVDPEAQYAAVLSIPRDLYVEVPGYGQNRINTAYAYGESSGAGGLALASRTVSSAVGVPVDHVVLIDFNAFVTFIDAIGGVDIEVPYAISDPTYPDSGIGYDPFYISAGLHHMDGATALKYARTRATAGGDFDRAARQRQIVMAVRDRVLNLGLLPDLLRQSPQLWVTVRDSVETDLTLEDAVGLVLAASAVPSERIKMGAIDESCTTPWVTPGGASVLLPNPSAIAAVVADLFSPPPPGP